MDFLNIKTINLEEKIDNNKNHLFKPYPDSIDYKKVNQDNIYKIILSSSKPINIQFKINSKFVSKILFKYLDSEYSIDSIPSEGILINCYLDTNKDFSISPIINEECARVNLFDIKQTKVKKLKNISWEKIFIINLPRRSDRKDLMAKMLDKCKITNYEFIEAVDGNDPDILKEFNELKQTTKTQIVSSGHYGCLLSHIKTIEKAKKEKLNEIMILEDDIQIDENFSHIINSIMVPKYDMLYLGGIIPEIKFLLSGWARTNEIMGAYGYILKKHMYDTILEKLYKKIYCVDIGYIEYIQSNYPVYILDDVVKTNLDSSDTSNKSKILVKLLDRTLIKINKINYN
jgi:hypothetical protein